MTKAVEFLYLYDYNMDEWMHFARLLSYFDYVHMRLSQNEEQK